MLDEFHRKVSSRGAETLDFLMTNIYINHARRFRLSGFDRLFFDYFRRRAVHVHVIDEKINTGRRTFEIKIQPCQLPLGL